MGFLNCFKLKDKFTFKYKCPDNYSPHVIQDVYVFLSSVENKLRFLMKTFQDLYSYSAAIYWMKSASLFYSDN